MKITIGETTVILACTAEGKQALKTDKLTPRQRQFILLVEENTHLGEQAVSNLLPKLDVQALIEKGWIQCDAPQVQLFKQPIAIAELVNTVAENAAGEKRVLVETDSSVMTKKSFDKKQGVKGLQSFLSTYASDSMDALALPKSVHVAKADLSTLQQADPISSPVMKQTIHNQSIIPQLTIPAALKPTTGQETEDIMILQSLLDD